LEEDPEVGHELRVDEEHARRLERAQDAEEAEAGHRQVLDAVDARCEHEARRHVDQQRERGGEVCERGPLGQQDGAHADEELDGGADAVDEHVGRVAVRGELSVRALDDLFLDVVRLDEKVDGDEVGCDCRDWPHRRGWEVEHGLVVVGELGGVLQHQAREGEELAARPRVRDHGAHRRREAGVEQAVRQLWRRCGHVCERVVGEDARHVGAARGLGEEVLLALLGADRVRVLLRARGARLVLALAPHENLRRPDVVRDGVDAEGEEEPDGRVDEAGADVAREEDVQSVVDGLGEEVAARAVGRRVRRHVVPDQPDGGAAVCEDPEVRQQAVVEVEHLERLQRAQHAVQPKHGDDQVPDAHARREQRASRHVDEERHRRRRPRPERVVSVEDGAQPEAQLHEGEEAVHRHHRRCVRPRLCRRPRRGGHLAVRAADDGPLDEVRLHPREGGEEEQGDRERPVERVLNKVVLRLVVVWKLGEPRKALLDERDRVLECTDGDRRADDEDRVELEVGERHSLY